MKKKNRKRRFEVNETGYHKSAKKILCEWVNGEMEKEFYIWDRIVFVPDIVCMNGNRIDNIYEVVYTHPIDGKKLGLMQAYGYLNGTGFSVFEVSADWVLKQTKKPERIETMELYEINPIT